MAGRVPVDNGVGTFVDQVGGELAGSKVALLPPTPPVSFATVPVPSLNVHLDTNPLATFEPANNEETSCAVKVTLYTLASSNKPGKYSDCATSDRGVAPISNLEAGPAVPVLRR